MLEIRNLSVESKAHRLLLDCASIKIKEGEIWGLTGESGAGKSTLLKSIMGILGSGCYVKSGEIFLNGEDVLKRKPGKRCELCGTELGLIPQNPMTAFDERLTIKNQILETVKVKKNLKARAAMPLIEEKFKKVNLTDVNRVLENRVKMQGFFLFRMMWKH